METFLFQIEQGDSDVKWQNKTSPLRDILLIKLQNVNLTLEEVNNMEIKLGTNSLK
jgi:hypothetical protein